MFYLCTAAVSVGVSVQVSIEVSIEVSKSYNYYSRKIPKQSQHALRHNSPVLQFVIFFEIPPQYHCVWIARYIFAIAVVELIVNTANEMPGDSVVKYTAVEPCPQHHGEIVAVAVVPVNVAETPCKIFHLFIHCNYSFPSKNLLNLCKRFSATFIKRLTFSLSSALNTLSTIATTISL